MSIIGHKTEALKCQLTPEEARARATELADSCKELDDHKVEAAGIRKDLRDTEDEIHERVETLYNAVRNGFEVRDIKLDMVLNGAQVDEIRADTGEVCKTRAASPDEMQAKLF